MEACEASMTKQKSVLVVVPLPIRNIISEKKHVTQGVCLSLFNTATIEQSFNQLLSA